MLLKQPKFICDIRNGYNILDEKFDGSRTLDKPRWDNNITTDVKEIRYMSGNWNQALR
jgi:hypothetical protein